MKVQEMKLADITPYENNPRNNEEAVEYVANSIREFGWQQPLVVDKDLVIIAGHTRYKAALKLGLDSAPVVIADSLTEEQVKAYRLADNKTAEAATWNEEALLAELGEIGIDMTMFGFDPKMIAGEDPEVIEDDVPDVEETTETKRGDIFILGDHRLMCGDSTSEEDLKKLMAGEKADMVFTDPPYGVSIGDKNKTLNSAQPAGRILENIANDTLPTEDLYKVLVKAFANLKKNGAKESCSYYVTSPQGGELCMMMMMMMKDAGLPVRHVLIWVKNVATFSLGRLDYDYRHEPIFYTWSKSHKFYGDYSTSVIDDTLDINKMKKAELVELVRKLMYPNQDSVIYENKPLRNDLHPTMKPVKLVARFIHNNSKKGEAIVDIFGGSGSTLIACEQLKRKCYMMELDPKYCDVIVKRWENLTGRKAVKLET